MIHCHINERICEIIEKYRKKANDYNDNFFFYNKENLDGISSTLKEKKIV